MLTLADRVNDAIGYPSFDIEVKFGRGADTNDDDMQIARDNLKEWRQRIDAQG